MSGMREYVKQIPPYQLHLSDELLFGQQGWFTRSPTVNNVCTANGKRGSYL